MALELIHRHIVFDGTFNCIPVDFLLWVNAANHILVGLKHPDDVLSLKANISINEQQMCCV